MAEAAESLWIVVQRVDGGDWSRQGEVWQAMAEHARDFYFALLKEIVDDARRATEKG